MRRLVGSSVQEMTQGEFRGYAALYKRVSVDIGTGDGKRLYRVAKANPDTLYIGIDPVKENMSDTARKLQKKPEKGGLKNLLLVIGAVEALPDELEGMADEVTVYFPWGSLLECVVKPVFGSMKQIYRIAKEEAAFTIVTTYQTSYEAGEIERRELPELSAQYFEADYKEEMRALGFWIDSVSELSAEDVKVIGTQWAKRLGTGRARRFYRVNGIIRKGLD